MKATFILALLASVAVADISYNQFINDNNVLNYALTLENLEAEFYRQGLLAFPSADNFTNAGYPAGTRDLIQFIANQEASHATFIKGALNARGYAAVTPCVYNFTVIGAFASATAFVQTIAFVENVGTQAYDGASTAITSPTLLEIAAGIATIEAKHTSSINLLFATVNSSFPTNFEVAKSEMDVFNTVKGLFVTCTPSTYASPYAGSVTVVSSDPTTYTWQTAASLRGSGTTQPETFYYKSGANATNIANNDFSILQYALFLENLEATFYATFASAYSVNNIMADPTIGKLYNTTTAGIVSNSIAGIAAHETAHVAFLNSTINQYGNAGFMYNGMSYSGAAVCSSYNWTTLGLSTSQTPTFSAFLAAASALESTGVGAYVGAIKYLQDNNYALNAATIATVEARHAAYISSIAAGVNSTNGALIFPSAQPNDTPRDLPTPPTTVVQTVTATLPNLIPVSCLSKNGNPPPLGGVNGVPDFFNDRNGPVVSPFVATNSGTPSTTTTPNGGGGTPGGNGGASTTSATTTAGRSSDATVVAASVAIAAVVAALL